MSLLPQNSLLLPILSVVVGLFVSTQAYAEDDPAESCNTAAGLFSEGDIKGALEEARWCVTQLEQLKSNEISASFLDEIGGYTGGELTVQQAMGVSVVERSYNKSNQVINVSLTGSAAGGMNNAFAALAAMGMQAGPGEKIRIQKRTAMVIKEGATAQVVVTLKSDGILTFESDNVSSDELVVFAKEFPVADLDDSIE